MTFIARQPSRVLPLVAVLISALLASSAALAQVPRGVFCLLPVGGGTGPNPSVYSNVDVDGISVRQNWSDLEATENVYDWRYLDKVIAKAAVAHKQVLLRI